MIPGKYPRVVVISSNPLRKDMSNGIFMRSLFTDWPKDRLANIYFPVIASYLPEMDVCHEHRMIRTSGLVRRYHHPRNQRRITDPQKECGISTSTANGRWRRRLVYKLRGCHGVNRWLRIIQEAWYSYSWIGTVLERELKTLKPDIICAGLGNWCLTRITCKACEKLAIPLLLLAGDDFVTALYKDVPFGTRVQSLSDRWYRRIVNYADGLATISPVMSEEYGRRYGKSWAWFTTLVNADDYDPSPRSQDGVIRLTYAGNLGLERWKSLRKLALALKQIDDRSGMNVRLDIYSSSDQLESHRVVLDIPPVTNLQGWISPKQLPDIFHNSDALVHVESFDPSLTSLTRLSFSTKLSQYMMSGRCIVMFGPGNIGSTQMVQMANAGITINSDDSRTLNDALTILIEGASLRQRYGHNGRLWAMKWFEAKAGQERFQTVINEALEQSRRKRCQPVSVNNRVDVRF